MTHLGVQLYSLRKAGPVEALLSRIAALGYDGVEVVMGAVADAPKFASRLREHGLAARAAHVALEALETDLRGVVAGADALGVEWIVAPYLPPEDRPADLAGWRRLGGRLARVAERLAPKGLRLAWHNHDFEFAPLADGSCGLEHIVAPDAGVAWEADLAWIARAGADPLHWLARHRGQVPLVHVKDLAAAGTGAEGGWADPGHGTLDWAALWRAARDAGAVAMIAEHDEPSDADRFLRRAIRTMRALDGA